MRNPTMAPATAPSCERLARSPGRGAPPDRRSGSTRRGRAAGLIAGVAAVAGLVAPGAASAAVTALTRALLRSPSFRLVYRHGAGYVFLFAPRGKTATGET